MADICVSYNEKDQIPVTLIFQRGSGDLLRLAIPEWGDDGLPIDKKVRYLEAKPQIGPDPVTQGDLRVFTKPFAGTHVKVEKLNPGNTCLMSIDGVSYTVPC